MNILKNDLIGNYVPIQPITITFIDLIQANVLTASIIDDNLENASVIKYVLYNLEITETENKAIMLYTGTLTIGGEDYKNWIGDSSFVYSFIANKIPITLIN